MGIVGQNGAGKSTLIKICTEQIIPDTGRITWYPQTTVGYLDQYAMLAPIQLWRHSSVLPFVPFIFWRKR